MTPFPADAVRAVQHFAVHHHAAAHTRAGDHPEHGAGTRRGAVAGFRQRKAIGVIGQPDFPSQRPFQVTAQGFSDQPGGVGILDQIGAEAFAARNRHATLLSPSLPNHALDGRAPRRGER